MADAGPPPSGGALPPAGPPTGDATPSGIPGSLIFQSPASLGQQQTSQSVPQAPPGVPGAQIFGAQSPPAATPPAAPAGVPGSQIFGGAPPASAPRMTPVFQRANFPPSSAQDQVQGPNPNFTMPGTNDALDLTNGTRMRSLALPYVQGADSAAGWGMKQLAKPQGMLTNSVIAGAAAMGIPGAAELHQQTNPNKDWFPPTSPLDITNFVADKSLTAAGLNGQNNFWNSLYRGSAGGLGLALNIATDPLMCTRMFQLTEEAQSLQKSGNFMMSGEEGAQVLNPAATARNLIEFKMPFSDVTVAKVPLSPVADAILKTPVVGPIVGTAAKIIREFGVDTGNPVFDRAANDHAMQGYGQTEAIKQSLIKPAAAFGFSDAENKVIYDLAESTANIPHPDIPAKVINASRGALSGEEGAVREKMAEILPDIAKTHGVDLLPGRSDSLIEGAMLAKRADSEALGAMVRGGAIDETNVADKIIENHMPHVRDPKYDGIPGDSVEARANGKYVSGASPIRQRTMTGKLTEINARIEAETGANGGTPMKDFFITDPFTASAVRLSRALKYERDAKLLDSAAQFGQRFRTAYEADAAGYAPVNHPAFAERNYTITKSTPTLMDTIANPALEGRAKTQVLRPGQMTDLGSNASAIQVKQGQMYFPKQISGKLEYFINPKAVYNFKGSLSGISDELNTAINAGKAVNQVFKSTALMSMGITLRNAAQNLVKGVANGVTAEDFANAFKGLSGMDRVKQAQYTRLGIGLSNSFQDGIGGFLDIAKKMTLGDAMSSPMQATAKGATNVMEMVAKLGEKGENLTRAAFFENQLAQGKSESESLYQMNKYLFNFRQLSPLTAAVQFFRPFTQHAVKSLALAPEMIGKNPEFWNMVSNSFPKVLANAFHDPVSQEEINQVLPQRFRFMDSVAGPLLPGNTWLSSILTNPKQPGSLGSLVYFKPDIGLGILNQFDVFSKAAVDQQNFQHYGLSPFFGALMDVMKGKSNVGEPIADGASRLNYMLRQGVLGNIAFPNTYKYIEQKFGIGNPDYYQSKTALFINGSFGQFGGITDLDQQLHSKLGALYGATNDLKETLGKTLSQAQNAFKSGQSDYSMSANQKTMVQPISNQQLIAETKAKMGEQKAEISGQMSAANLGASALKGQTSAQDFISRIKSINDTVGKVNEAYQLGVMRYLQMSAGAKSPAEARAKAGVNLYKR